MFKYMTEKINFVYKKYQNQSLKHSLHFTIVFRKITVSRAHKTTN